MSTSAMPPSNARMPNAYTPPDRMAKSLLPPVPLRAAIEPAAYGMASSRMARPTMAAPSAWPKVRVDVLAESLRMLRA